MRRIAVGDIHGCSRTFRALIEEEINLSFEDEIYLLGDYVDRGPDSKGVLDYIFELIDSGYNVKPLKGNHEEDLLKYNQEEFRYLEWHLSKNHSLNLLDGEGLQNKYADFFESLPYYYELEHCYIVHAGFNFSSEDPFSDRDGMLVQRDFTYSEEHLKGKTVIHGHQPAYIDIIQERINKREKIIPLDNGVPYVKRHKVYEHTQLGGLCGLDIDSYELYRCLNRDM